MNLFDQATQYVALKYDGKRRTALQIPYATHLFGVARILKSNGYSDKIVVAGLLHDILEDGIATEQELTTLFGEDVLAIIKDTTELSKSYSWQQRKEDVIARIQQKSDEALVVLLAEKIHNIRSIIDEVAQFGEELWDKFNAPKEKQEWYYRSMLEEVIKYHPNALLLPIFEQAIDKLFVKVEL